MPGREDIFQKAMNEGHSAAWDQEWGEAASAYRRALGVFPDNANALSNLGLALLQTQQLDESLKTYRRLARVSSNDPVAFERIAQLSERLGQIREAVDAALKAGELYLNDRDVDKAIENWGHVIMLDPEHVRAHSRLALTHEKLGNKQQAVTEYLAIASLLQRSGSPDKAVELVNRALHLMPASAEAKQAQTLLRTRQLLPKPVRPKGGTAPLAMAQVRQLEKPKQEAQSSSLDPVEDARGKALTKLAEMLFDYSDESPDAKQRRGLSAIVKGTGYLSLQQAEQTKIVLHLGQAIDAQSKHDETQAAAELENVLEAGLNHPAIYFDLGLLRFRGERLESALRHLRHAVQHVDYALGARLLMGEILQKQANLQGACVEYLEALKFSDAMTVPEDMADEIGQLYEPLIEAHSTVTDNDDLSRLCANIKELLMRPNWREHLQKTREQMSKTQEGNMPLPLAEVIIQAQSSQVLESMSEINALARQGRLRPAMDEAFHALISAPTYLPLHTLIGDLLIQEERIPEAIEKYTVVASAYSVRGESNQAAKLLRRVLEHSPMDMYARTQIIELLLARGEVDDAIKEYIELADVYYRLAELDMARKTFTTALRVVQQANADRAWNVPILQRMADIDMQRLDWKQAVRVFEQIRTLGPDDQKVRKQLIDLNLRLAQQNQAQAELESYLSYLGSNGRGRDAIMFLEELVAENEDQLILRRALADHYKQAGQVDKAVEQLDVIGEMLIESGKNDQAAEVIRQIILLNPPNVNKYRQALQQIQPE
jgi:tetratricopeptide (TPR) repeat protein